MICASRAWLSFMALVLMCAPAAGQTRADEIRKQREAKAQSLTPPRPGQVERALFTIEDSLIVERIFNPPRGFYPRIGGLGEGAGFGFGPGYRYSTYDVDFRVSGAYSIKTYWLGEAKLIFPHLGTDHLFAEIYAPPPRFSAGGLFRHRPRLRVLGSRELCAPGHGGERRPRYKARPAHRGRPSGVPDDQHRPRNRPRVSLD